jgi:hypothetical protein
MFVDNDISESKKKVGYYVVNGVKYSNKFHALTKCTGGEYPVWNFNNEVFSKCDFTTNPSDDLYDIYKKRAIQLREKYDNVVIYFSGGIDSYVILRTFLEANLKIDGVIVCGTWKLDKKLPTENYNTLEQNNMAVPLLKQLEKDYNVKLDICFKDVTDDFYHYNDDNFVYELGGNTVSPRMLIWNHVWRDPWFQNKLMKGKTCGIKGIDKPRVFIENGKWYFAFLDVLMNDATPSGHLDAKNDHDIQEFFYWTPDMPELAVKQAHVVIDWLENNCSSELLSKIATKEAKMDAKTYYKYVDPLVYGRYVNQEVGGDRNYFCLPKPIAPGMVQKDLWFHQLAKNEESTKKYFDVWLSGINKLQSNIDPKFLNQAKHKLKPKNQQHFNKKWNNLKNEYHLHKMIQPESSESRHIIFGPVGFWSPFYYVKESKHKIN